MAADVGVDGVDTRTAQDPTDEPRSFVHAGAVPPDRVGTGGGPVVNRSSDDQWWHTHPRVGHPL